MIRLPALILLALAAAFALGYYSEQLPPALWRALTTTLLFSSMWWGTHYSTVWIGRLMERYRE